MARKQKRQHCIQQQQTPISRQLSDSSIQRESDDTEDKLTQIDRHHYFFSQFFSIFEQRNQHSTQQQHEHEDLPVLLDWTISIFVYLTDVVIKGLYIIKPLLSILVALYIFKMIIFYGWKHFLDITCPYIPTPFLPLLPACQHWNDPVPNFSQLVTVQEKLCNTVLTHDSTAKRTGFSGNSDSFGDTTHPLSALALKQVELATRDLQMMVKHSNLAYKELLGEKMTEYLMHSRTFGRDIQSMQAQGKGVIDNLITYNTVTLRKLSNVENGKTSRQELRLIYEASMGLIEKEARRLILAIEKAQGSLDVLEADLYAIQEITIQEKSHQRAERPHVLVDLVNMVRGRELQRPLVRENMELLLKYDVERSKSSERLMMLLDRMEAVQMDLEELRTQVVAPIVIPDSLPLEMHIENINKAIIRLKQGKWTDYDQQRESDTLSSSLESSSES